MVDAVVPQTETGWTGKSGVRATGPSAIWPNSCEFDRVGFSRNDRRDYRATSAADLNIRRPATPWSSKCQLSGCSQPRPIEANVLIGEWEAVILVIDSVTLPAFL